ncbi:nucleotidyl transferase AbiEii/AbiGii toxin family protein [Salicola sp. Rm-C-2C1-2]|uniref:nucleotidyl transferase AbiEii/AbiGii toxin family protein n=1 Tax=Salicola sp. Rm-C-2C1-2 TaxID=3141321 RepID=UPI0032E50B46
MAFDERYRQQMQLLFQLLPIVAREKDFALKGGTAINLFELDMPRLSVDLDLAYLGMEARDEALDRCRKIMERLAGEIERRIPQSRVERRLHDRDEIRVIVKMGPIMVKMESSPVARGAVGPVIVREAQPRVQDQFGYAAIQCISSSELFGGKFCAALDRQHPRDLFDVLQLMERDGVTREIFDGFLVALMSSNRPMAEILEPNRKDFSELFRGEFQGMAELPVSLESLEQAREELIHSIHRFMTADDRAFLLDFKRGAPDWNQFAYPEAQNLPAILWKQLNLDRMNPDKRQVAIERLDSVLARMV